MPVFRSGSRSRGAGTVAGAPEWNRPPAPASARGWSGSIAGLLLPASLDSRQVSGRGTPGRREDGGLEDGGVSEQFQRGQRDQEPIPSRRVGHPKGGQQHNTLAGGKILGLRPGSVAGADAASPEGKVDLSLHAHGGQYRRSVVPGRARPCQLRRLPDAGLATHHWHVAAVYARPDIV